jgi:hypothetical protein
VYIPAKYKFHEEWNEIRDQAIRECKTFVMIVTWLFESSPEIINEINLVKQYKDKDFLVQQATYDHVLLIDGDEIIHPDFYDWMQQNPDKLIHVRQVHMKNYSSWYMYGGEKIRAGAKDRMVFDDIWNTNVIYDYDVVSPYCILNWGYAALSKNRVADRLVESKDIHDGKGTWWEIFEKDNIDDMLKTFIEKRGRPLEKVSFILPPRALFPDLGEPLRDTRSGFRKFLVMLPELPRLLAKP